MSDHSAVVGWPRLVADLERTATARGREELGHYSIEGLRLHERALRAGVHFAGTVAGEGFAVGGQRCAAVLEQLERAGAALALAPDSVLERLVEGRGLGAILSLVPLPAPTRLDGRTDGRPLLVLVDIEDPGNVGALLRTALAAGAIGVACIGRSEPFHPKAVRTSMGAVFKTAVLRYPDAEPLLVELQERGFLTLAAVARGGTPLPEQALSRGVRPTAVFVGSESFGLPPALVQRLDARVSIPMPAGSADSFSVNAAAAIVLYELCRNAPWAATLHGQGAGR